MNFKLVGSKISFPKIEERLLKSWQKNKVFEKLKKLRKRAKKFIFYDGPPFATGLPHYGHILAMSIKDAVVRQKFMQGYNVPLKLGWDCHGLPVEYEVEKELGIKSKQEIEELGIEKFCAECRQIVFRNLAEWMGTIERMGRLMDTKNTYATLDNNYIESVWWIFSQIWQKGLIYQGAKSMPYCPRCATPLSNFETNQGYQDNVADPSIYVKFQLEKEPDTFLLIWTTTPWTLPGNSALAINPKIEYVKAKKANQYLIFAKAAVERVGNFEKLEKVSTSKLIGAKYKPLYQINNYSPKSFQVVAADFVSTNEGTGIVHVAPAFGEEDLELSKTNNLPIFQTVDRFGKIKGPNLPGSGKFVKDADSQIISDLKKRGLLEKSETIYHTYPFCWRCDTPLIYYLISTWFIKVSVLQKKLVAANKKVYWVPEHIKSGRFGKWLAQAQDWAVSRDRFWGAPVPIWICPSCGESICVGSILELKKLAIDPYKITDLHRPYIDEVKLKSKCGGQMTRVSQILDCWFESGSMPYAQVHYPFEGKIEFKTSFPADFIAEGLDQTRGWFYTLHVIATILFSQPAFKNCIVNGLVLDGQGRKLSKRLRNYPEPEEVFADLGADSLRFLLLSSPAAVGENLLFSKKAVEDVTRKVFLILWNVYNFFVTYAVIANWQPKDKILQSSYKNVLDRWIISRLNSTILEVTKFTNSYYLPQALRRIANFITELSTWYVRRSRNRIGPTVETGPDKEQALQTLYHILINISKLLAPFAPFVADEIYQNLTSEVSVHLSDWPEVTLKLIDKKLEKEMEQARKVVELAHAARKEAKIKVRQPLLLLKSTTQISLSGGICEVIGKEINVKKVENKIGKEVTIWLDTTITPELKAEGEARELIRKIQEERKKLGCNLTEKVEIVTLFWPAEFEAYILNETLANKISKGGKFKVIRTVKIA